MKNPPRIWDCVERRYVLVIPWVLSMTGDNPMQAVFTSNIGLQGNKPCRCCHMGGNEVYKHSSEGFMAVMVVRERDSKNLCHF